MSEEKIVHKTDEYIQELEEFVKNNDFDVEQITLKLKRIRPEVIKYGDPLVTKVLRLAYEHIEANDAFEISYLEDEVLQEEMDDFGYFIELLKGRDNPRNREELKEYRDLLYAAA